MSFKDTIMSSINSTVNNYISIISKKYNIKENELYEIWSGNSEISQTTSQNQELEKLSKPELIEMCKSKKLKVSGSKNDLINRIILNETQNKQQHKQKNKQASNQKNKQHIKHTNNKHKKQTKKKTINKTTKQESKHNNKNKETKC